MAMDKFATVLKSTGGKQVSRRGLVKGAAGVGMAAAASTTFSVLPTVGQEKGKITFWTTHSGTGFDALSKIGDDFNAQNEKYEVEVIQRPPAAVSDSASLITAVRGGEGPDVYLLDRFIVAERAAQGLLQDLTDLMTAAGDNTDLTEKYVGFSAAEATYDNKPFALPFDTDVRGLFFNRGILTAAGVDLEPFNKDNGPMTFDTLHELIAPLNVSNGDNFDTMGFVPYFGQGFHYTWGFAFGGEFFDYENCKVTPDTPENLAGAQWVYDYCQQYGADKVYAFVQNAIRVGAAPTDSPFVQGRLATMLNGNWMFANFRTYQPDDDIGYTYMPVGTEGQESFCMAGGWSGVVPQGAKNPEGGYEFVRYLCGPEGSRTYVQMNNNLPVLRELLEDESLFDEALLWFVKNVFPTTKFRPPLPVGAKYWDELEAAWDSIRLNISSPEDAYATARENTQAELDAGGYCPIAPPPV